MRCSDEKMKENETISEDEGERRGKEVKDEIYGKATNEIRVEDTRLRNKYINNVLTFSTLTYFTESRQHFKSIVIINRYHHNLPTPSSQRS